MGGGGGVGPGEAQLQRCTRGGVQERSGAAGWGPEEGKELREEKEGATLLQPAVPEGRQEGSRLFTGAESEGGAD